MDYKEITLPSKDGYKLSLRVFDAKDPKGVIQVAHGMEEHQDRYKEFAKYLAKNSYIVITADMRGHGKNAPKLGHIADKNGHKLLIEDMQAIKDYIKKTYKNLPIILFAHSMGTITSRALLQTDSKEYSKVVLSGYPNPQGVASVAIVLSNIIGLFKGKDKKSNLLKNSVTGKFSKMLKDAKTPLDWLSYNKENIKKFKDDPLCGDMFTIGSYNALFHLVSDINKSNKYKNVKKDLPILLISGEDDPCTSGEKGRQTSVKKLKCAGFETIEVETIKNMRHEILNETKKDEVYELILNFIKK